MLIAAADIDTLQTGQADRKQVDTLQSKQPFYSKFSCSLFYLRSAYSTTVAHIAALIELGKLLLVINYKTSSANTLSLSLTFW